MNLLRENDISGLEKYLKEHNVNEEVLGQSLLSLAVFMNKMPFVKMLLELKADPNQKDYLGRSPLEVGCYFGFYEICQILLNHGGIITKDSIRRAENGWDGNRQSEIIELLQGWQSSQLND